MYKSVQKLSNLHVSDWFVFGTYKEDEYMYCFSHHYIGELSDEEVCDNDIIDYLLEENVMFVRC